MIAAVTGASGHLGANLVRALLDGGFEVRALVRKDRRALQGLSIQLVEGDLQKPDPLRELVSGADLVIHAAGHIALKPRDVDLAWQVNVEGTRSVVDACVDCSVARLVHVSSVHALDPHPIDQVLDESRPLAGERTFMAYDRTKATAEKVVLEAVAGGLDAVILNPTALIGPHDYKLSVVGQVLLDIYHDRLPALVKGGFDWVDARDVALGIVAAAKRGVRGERYLLSGHWAWLCDLAALIEELTGRAIRLPVAPIWLARLGLPFIWAYCRLKGIESWYTRASLRTVEEGNQQVSHAKAERVLGYEPRPLKETLRDTFAWFEQIGWLDRAPTRER